MWRAAAGAALAPRRCSGARTLASAVKRPKPHALLPPGVAHGARDSVAAWATGTAGVAGRGRSPHAVPAWVRSRLKDAPDGERREGGRGEERGSRATPTLSLLT